MSARVASGLTSSVAALGGVSVATTKRVVGCMRAARLCTGGLFALVLGAPATLGAQEGIDVPYVPTPPVVVDAMLEMAKVGPADFVVDLGSGDGRIVIAAAKKYNARGLGVDINPSLVRDARREADRQGVGGKVEFRAENLSITEIGRASVLTTYLLTRLNLYVRPRIFSEMKPGSRVVSHEFDFGAWKSDAQQVVKVPDKPYGPPSSTIYLWFVPANAAGRWRGRIEREGEPVEYEITLEQTFQELKGTASVGGKPARIENARMRGEDIAFTLMVPGEGRELIYQLSGRVTPEAMKGTARVAGAATELAWSGARTARGRINLDAPAERPSF